MKKPVRSPLSPLAIPAGQRTVYRRSSMPIRIAMPMEAIFVVHNGIIENYAELREWLIREGYEFASETDTEVIPHLIDHYYKKSVSFTEAFVKALKEIRGAYAILAMTSHEPDRLFAARLSSPMVIGVGKGECIVASDPSAIMQHTKEVIYVQDNEMVIIEKGSYKITDLKRSAAVKRATEHLDFDVDEISLGDFPNFTLKEIFEAPQTIRLASLGRTQCQHPNRQAWWLRERCRPTAIY